MSTEDLISRRKFTYTLYMVEKISYYVSFVLAIVNFGLLAMVLAFGLPVANFTLNIIILILMVYFAFRSKRKSEELKVKLEGLDKEINNSRETEAQI